MSGYLKYKNYSISKIEDHFKSIFQTLKYCYNLEILHLLFYL